MAVICCAAINYILHQVDVGLLMPVHFSKENTCAYHLQQYLLLGSKNDILVGTFIINL